MIVGLTGGIGSGKTTVLEYFKALGTKVYIADLEAKKLMHESEIIREKLIVLFGEKAYVNGQLNRAFIADIVFKDKNKLKQLNAIVHPELRKHFLDFAKEVKNGYVIYESAILIENNNDSFCDKIILVTAPIEERIRRVMERDSVTKSQVMDRINNQLPDVEKRKKADIVIENLNLAETKVKVSELHEQFLKLV